MQVGPLGYDVGLSPNLSCWNHVSMSAATSWPALGPPSYLTIGPEHWRHDYATGSWTRARVDDADAEAS